MTDFELRFATSLSPDDEPVCAAIDRGRAAVGLAPRSRALWEWRAANPDGVALGVATDSAGAVRAAIFGMRHAVLLEGEETHWIEVVDVFNDFDGGRGLARTRAHLELGEAYAREFGGRAPDGAPVIHGLPTRRAHRLQLARLKTEILRSENALAIRPSSVQWVGEGVDVEELDAELPEELARYAAGFAASRSAIAVRDVERLAWRFRSHPEHAYRLAVARRGGAMCGFAALALGAYAGHVGGVLVDWLVAPEDGHAMEALLRWAGSIAAEAGHDVLVTNVPCKSPEFPALQAKGFHVHGTDEYVVFRGFQKPYVMSWLFESWYYTLADGERA